MKTVADVVETSDDINHLLSLNRGGPMTPDRLDRRFSLFDFSAGVF